MKILIIRKVIRNTNELDLVHIKLNQEMRSSSKIPMLPSFHSKSLSFCAKILNFCVCESRKQRDLVIKYS